MKKTLLFFLSLLSAPILAQTACDTVWYTGEGTQYGGIAGTNGGNCGIFVDEGDFYHCAMNHEQYDESMTCGACVHVIGPIGEIDLKIVDRCPECKHGDIDFSTEAFIRVAKLEDGRVPIKWCFIPCREIGGMRVKYELGMSQFYFKMAVYDHLYAIDKLEYQKKDGSWVEIKRTDYNYFVENAGIDEDKSKIGPYTFRITASTGESVVIKDVEYKEGGEVETGVQFSLTECDANNTVTKDKSSQDTDFEPPFQVFTVDGKYLGEYESIESIPSSIIGGIIRSKNSGIKYIIR
ncbi:MAG: hypothetical protein MJZ00_01180 [Paludibacteraceae bacterium]|nr:hypothetical protein [Paludibacteraceae bacterium]